MTTENEMTYAEAYERLGVIADQVDKMTAPDVDLLLPRVEEAAKCRTLLTGRIESVRAALAQFKPEPAENK